MKGGRGARGSQLIYIKPYLSRFEWDGGEDEIYHEMFNKSFLPTSTPPLPVSMLTNHPIFPLNRKKWRGGIFSNHERGI